MQKLERRIDNDDKSKRTSPPHPDFFLCYCALRKSNILWSFYQCNQWPYTFWYNFQLWIWLNQVLSNFKGLRHQVAKKIKRFETLSLETRQMSPFPVVFDQKRADHNLENVGTMWIVYFLVLRFYTVVLHLFKNCHVSLDTRRVYIYL